MIRDAGFGRYLLSDVRSVAGRLLRTGHLAGCARERPWAPAVGETWADAPAPVLEARRRAIVFGALAAAGCRDRGRVCPPLPVRMSFVVVGAIKGGTTALDHFLSQHRDICTALQKETHFFVREIFFQGDAPKYEWLDFSFQHYGGEQVMGEVTPEYMYFERAAERLHAYNDKLKLLLLLRDPAERAYSQYRMEVARGREVRPFEVAVREDASAEGGAEGTYTAGGFYLSYIRRLLKHFPREQMLLVRSEDLRHRHRDTLTSVHRFLGVSPEPVPPARALLVGPGPPLASADRAFLVQLYEAETRALESFLDLDLSHWRR